MANQQKLEQALVQSLEKTFGPLPESMVEVLQQAAREAGDKPAILEPDRESLSYSELLQLVESTIGILNEMGFGRKSRIALALPTSPEAATAYLSVMMGMTALALAPTASDEEYERLLKHTQVDAVLLQVGVQSAARETAQRLAIPVIEMTPIMDGPTGRFQ